MSSLYRRLATALRVARAEGPRAALDRARDRLDERREREKVTAASPGWLGRASVVTVLGMPPWPRLGGVPTQLRNRYAAESEERPCVTLFPDGKDWRLERQYREVLLAELQARGLKGDALRDAFVIRMTRDTFESSIWAHEGRHAVDKTIDRSMQSPELEFRAKLSDLGKRHPVTRGLEGGDEDPPHWSRWFRSVDARTTKGTNVMNGPDGKPLLVLSREGEGRVALLLSDHIWLWARGYEGGGPHLDLLRRLSHWSMKQPDLEEEALRILVRGRDLTVQRQTMADAAEEVTLTSPSGKTRALALTETMPGVWRSTIEANELGLWRANDSKLAALVNVGPANPREFSEVTSTPDVVAPLVSATGGTATRIEDGSGVHVPRLLGVRGDTFHGDDWLGLKIREASVVRGIGVLPVFAGMIGLLLLIGILAATWTREGR